MKNIILSLIRNLDYSLGFLNVKIKNAIKPLSPSSFSNLNILIITKFKSFWIKIVKNLLTLVKVTFTLVIILFFTYFFIVYIYSSYNWDLDHNTSVLNAISYKDSSSNNGIVENTLSTDTIFNTERNKFLESISSSSDNTNNFLGGYLDKYYNMIGNASTVELGAIGHLIISVTLLYELWGLVAIFYGDWMIIKFKLEDRYPRLAKYIRIRRKFQVYYFTYTSITMAIALLFVAYANLSILIHLH